MFGYVACNKAELTDEEIDRYRSAYCGLCMALKTQYGQIERFSLNYDMTFLALFLSSLYEPEERKREFRCAVHPMKKRCRLENSYVEYAADMTILLAYYKSLDDWQDDKNLIKKKYAKHLRRYMSDLEKKYPRQCRQMEVKIREFSKLEKSMDAMSDELINCSGELLSEIFVYQEDCWSGYLRTFGYEMGRFIYLMDAVLDYEKDMKSGNYNPFIQSKMKMEDAEQVLKIMIGNAVEQYEMLPMVRDDRLLKNILYSGVWAKYNAKAKEKEKKNHDGRSV